MHAVSAIAGQSSDSYKTVTRLYTAASPLPRLTVMSLTLGGTHPVSFQGGTFNNIAGNLNIVNTASESGYSAPLPQNREPSQHIEYGRDYRLPGQVGPPRTNGDAPHHHYMPYNRPPPPSISHQDSYRGFTDNHREELPVAPTHSNSTFYTVGGSMTNVNKTSYGENGLDILYRSVVKDAMHNSAERPPDPACHPGTRESVLDTLRAWSRDDSPHARLMWLYGCAGMGKSAIAQTFAAECQQDGILGASFFFRRGDTGRGNWKGLFPTLAYQLAASFPQLRDALRQAVEADKLVFGQAMRHQFQKLIIAPFEKSPQLALWPIVVIDGLDECENHGVQVMLLDLVIKALQTGAFPVRVLLVSRPEAHLREVLQASENFDVCRHLELRADASADADLRRYLGHEFSKIYKCHTSRGVFFEDGWPGEGAIDYLVNRSSGAFIYATTVVRYVDEEYTHPAERLKSVLRRKPDSTAPLDTLYTQILSTVPDRSILLRVLHAVLREHSSAIWDPEVIDAGLNIPAGTSRLVLRGLHSVLSVPAVRVLGCEYPTHEHEVKLLHASLGDFLRDPMRSLDFFVDTLELDCALVRTMIEFLSSSPINQDLFDTTAVHLLVWICGKQLGELLPTDDLLPILRDVDFQHVAYMSSPVVVNTGEVVDWLTVKKCALPEIIAVTQIIETEILSSSVRSHSDLGGSPVRF
ncbi:hypothetical protein DFH06DRAFT_393481 [Mycena polygramma]|nr:hypothetical protein DFH06DRAFT_393481 [Mycena polygramma]